MKHRLKAWLDRLRARLPRRFKAGRPDLEAGMSSFTPDFDQHDKSQVTDRGRISSVGIKHGDV
jgi:hypothetical protein